MADGTIDFETYRDHIDSARTPDGGRPCAKRHGVWTRAIAGLSARFGALRRWLGGRPADTTIDDELQANFEEAPGSKFAQGVSFEAVGADGRAEGGKLLPTADSNSPADSPSLSRLMAAANAAAVRTRAVFMAGADSGAREITRAHPDPRPAITNLVARAEHEIEHIESEAKEAFVANCLAVVKTKARVNEWLGAQGRWLDRNEPDQPNLAVTAAFILLCLAVETIGNALALEDSFPDGLHGAIEVSLFIAGLNIGFGLFAGFAFGRCRHHVNGATRSYGWIGSILSGLLAAVLLFGLAGARHETSALKESFDNALETSGIWTLVHPDFMLTDLRSAALWLVGMILWLLSFAEGHRAFSDPYVDFSRQVGRIVAAKAKADRSFHEIREAQEEVIEGAQADIEELHHEAKAYADRQRANLGAFERGLKYLAAQRGVIEETLQAAFRCYAIENRRCRGDVPSPIWFGRLAHLSFDWPAFRVDAFDALVAATHKRTDEIYAAVTHALEDLEAARQRSLDRLNDARNAALGTPVESPEAPLPPPTDSQLRRGY